MIRAAAPGIYYMDARRFNYYDAGAFIPVWIGRNDRLDGSRVQYRVQPLRDGEPVGSPVFVSGSVLYRDVDGEVL